MNDQDRTKSSFKAFDPFTQVSPEQVYELVYSDLKKQHRENIAQQAPAEFAKLVRNALKGIAWNIYEAEMKKRGEQIFKRPAGLEPSESERNMDAAIDKFILRIDSAAQHRGSDAYKWIALKLNEIGEKISKRG